MIENVQTVVGKEKNCKIEIAVQLEAAFQIDTERKLFYTKHNRQDEEERIPFNHRNVYTIYCAPKYWNILAVHLLSTLSSDPDAKYLTTRCQQIFVPAPGSCISFEPKQSFAAYLADTGRISVISDSAITIDSIQPEKFHSPLTTDETSPLFISPYNIISQMPISKSDPLPDFLQRGNTKS